MNFDSFEVLTFDCYGTLIDWETGLLKSIGEVASNHNATLTDEKTLELFGEIEARIEAGSFLKYRTVLERVVAKLGERLGFIPTASELRAFPDSIRQWLPFPDTVAALETLKQKYKLAVLSNIDKDLFAYSAAHLRVEFDWVFTAEDIGSYKPELQNFRFALEHIGTATEHVLHVAQSQFHDIIPAQNLGLSTVWVNRRHDQEGPGATPPVAKREVEVPDLAALVRMAGLSNLH